MYIFSYPLPPDPVSSPQNQREKLRCVKDMLPGTSLACRLQGHPVGALLPAPRSSSELFLHPAMPNHRCLSTWALLTLCVWPMAENPREEQGQKEQHWILLGKGYHTRQVFLRTHTSASPPNPFELFANFPCHTNKHTSPAHFSVRETLFLPSATSLPQGFSFPLHLYHSLASRLSSCSCLPPNLPIVPTTIKGVLA